MNKSATTAITILLSIFLMLIAAWFLVHFLTIFGIFLAVAYPIWYVFAPSQTPCLICRTKKDGEVCPLCRRQVNKSISISPSGLRSIISNSLIILILSLVSSGIVFGEMKILHAFGIPPTPRTVSFVIPNTKQYRLGELFPMRLEIVGIQESINTVQTDIGFDPASLEAVDVTTEGSFANVFVQKEINNQVGFVRLTGGLPNPGYSGPQGTFGTIYFRSKLPGLVEVKFLPSSLVLANDGRGTNVLKELSSVSYLILPERISPEQTILQNGQINLKKDSLASGATQMTFFSEKTVLGTSDTVIEDETLSFTTLALTLLEKIDSFLFSFYAKSLSLFR